VVTAQFPSKPKSRVLPWCGQPLVVRLYARGTVTSERDRPSAGYGDHVTEELPEGTARYQEVADSLRERIDSGELPPGAMLPSVTRISQEWGVSPTTAGNALKLLHSEGLIRTGEGGDTFVAGPDD